MEYKRENQKIIKNALSGHPFDIKYLSKIETNSSTVDPSLKKITIRLDRYTNTLLDLELEINFKLR